MPAGSQTIVGRFAPSPTGFLHTGSLVAAIGSYLMAKRGGGRWLLRIDDLDTPRQIPGMADEIMRVLESFSLFWDGDVSWQSRHTDYYRQAFDSLLKRELIYPCGCSRKEIAMAASAPHPEDDCIPYGGRCRHGLYSGATVRSWRVMVPEGDVCFNDLRRGRVCQNLAGVSGDFALRRGESDYLYQLAVVVDDAVTGVNQVVRGEDLLSSTPRQIYLQRLLGIDEPLYCHLPLVTGPGGTKLSKRDNPISLQAGSGQATEGTRGEQVFRVLRFLGQDPPETLSGSGCRELLEWGVACFDPDRLPAGGGVLAV